MTLKIGSHVSFSGTGLLNAAEEAIGYGATTFMVYTGAPQNTRRKPMTEHFVPEGQALMARHGIDEIVVHAPYIINLGSPRPDTFQHGIEFLQQEMERTAFLGVKQLVLHPGAFTEKDLDYGIERVATGLTEVLAVPGDVHIALETMAGKGTEIGRRFEELAAIIERVPQNRRLSVCFDTCHVHDAGYNIVADLDGVLAEFDRIIGLERLAVVHINDSKNPSGAGKDRHTPIGSGYIGFAAMRRVVEHAALQGRPFILETPWIGREKGTQRPMYAAEIALLSGRLLGSGGDEDESKAALGPRFLDDVESIARLLQAEGIAGGGGRGFILETWLTLQDKKARAGDGREPMQRLHDIIAAAGLFPDYTEEQINHRLVGYFARQ